LEFGGFGRRDRSGGENFDLTVQLHNYGTAAISDIEAICAQIIPISRYRDSMAAWPPCRIGRWRCGFSGYCNAGSPGWHDSRVSRWALSSGANINELKFTLPIGGLLLIPADIVVESGSLEPGETAAYQDSADEYRDAARAKPDGHIKLRQPSGQCHVRSDGISVLLPNATAISSNSCAVTI